MGKFKSPVQGHEVVCQVCGFNTHISEIQRRWDNLLVCKEDFELRHPQDVLPIPRSPVYPKILNPDPESAGYTTLDSVYPTGVKASDL